MSLIKEDESNVSYLGDGVYAIHDGFGVWLYANDHLHPTDRVYLEPSVLAALNKFVERMRSFYKAKGTNKTSRQTK